MSVVWRNLIVARVTIEDCLVHVNNPFDLVLIAAKRARKLVKNPTLIPKVPAGNNKSTVIALREIAAGFVDHVLYEQVEEDIDMQRAKEMALAQKPVIENNVFDD